MVNASPARPRTPTPRPAEKGKMKATVVPPATLPKPQPPIARAAQPMPKMPQAPKAAPKAHASHAPPLPPSYAKAAAPGPTRPKPVTRPSLVVSLHNPIHISMLQSKAMTPAPRLVDACNEALASEAHHANIWLSAAKWAPSGNLVIFAGPETSLTQLQSAHHIIVTAVKGALPGTSALSSHPNVKWSKLLIRSVPTGVTDRISQAHSREACHQALLADNPSYRRLQVT
jgi:hypothetical protein